MYDHDDPILTRLREVCLAFPESVEVEAWGRPTFRAGKKIFAVYGSGEQDPNALIFTPDVEDRAALAQDPRFFIPPYLAQTVGWRWTWRATTWIGKRSLSSWIARIDASH